MSDRFLVQLIDGGTVTERIRVYATSGVGVVETNTIVTVAIAAHAADTTDVHGIVDTALLESKAGAQAKVDAHSADTTAVHGIADTALLETQAGAAAKVAAHDADTSVHGIADTTALETGAGAAAKVEAHRLDTTDVHGIADTALLVETSELNSAITGAVGDAYAYTDAHAADTTAVHGIADTADLISTTVENVFTVPQTFEADGHPVWSYDEDGNVWFGEVEDGKDFTDGGKMRPKVLIIRTRDASGVGQQPTRMWGPSGFSVFAPGDPPEVLGVIAGGTLRTGRMALAELAAGVDVTAAAFQPRTATVTHRERTGNTAMLTTAAPHPFLVGDTVTVKDMADQLFNGSKTLTAVTPNTMWFDNVGANVATVADPGTVTGSGTGELLLEAALPAGAGYDPGEQWPLTDPAPDTDPDADPDDLEGTRDRNIQLQHSGTHVANMTYNGRNDTLKKLTGVTYVSHTGSVTFDPNVTVVYRYPGKGATGLALFGMTDYGKAGTQIRHANLSFRADENQAYDGYGHFHAGGAIQFAPSTLGPWSIRKQRAVWGARGDLWFYGSHARAVGNEILRRRRLVVSAESTRCRGVQTIPATPTTPYTIAVRDPAGLPDPGEGDWPSPLYLTITTTTVPIEVAYTGYSVTNGQWYLTGVTSAAGTAGLTLNDSSTVDLARRNLGPVVGVKGNVVAQDFGDTDGYITQTTTGAVGPTATMPEAGIRAGAVGQGEVTLYREAAQVWSVGAAAVSLVEMTEPAAAIVNGARLFTKDNGAGKTQLCVKFNTGAPVVIATQP